MPILLSKYGILHLPIALARHHNNRVVLYCRVSERSMVANGSLGRQKVAESEGCQQYPCDLKRVVAGQEHGKMFTHRWHLRRALEAAREHDAILVAANLSRFIRAERYSATEEHWDEMPAAEELERLLKLADGTPLATLLRPGMPAKEVHSLATKRGNPGRPRKIDNSLGARLLYEYRDGPYFEGNPSIAELAIKHGLKKSTLARFLSGWVGHGYSSYPTYIKFGGDLDAWHAHLGRSSGPKP